MIFNAAQILIPFIIAFGIGIATAPILTHYLYKHQAWKKVAGKTAMDGTVAVEFNRIDQGREGHTPRMGGILIWSSVLITAFGLSVLGYFFNGMFSYLDFINRGQTWLPLGALVIGALVGLINDIKDITTDGKGIRLGVRLLVVAAVATFIGWWFYDKLDISSIGIPFIGNFELGVFFVPFFILVTIAIYAGGIIDGIDGLAGGIFAFIFMAYAGIAFSQEQIALAAFAATVSGAIFAFLWFNIPPARFWMTETGTMGLTLALSVTAFSTDVLGEGVGVAVLPIIAFPVAATVFTSILQITSKTLFKKKIFRIAPIHHHFEAIGWPSYKVTMRYWIIAIFAGIFGVAIALMK